MPQVAFSGLLGKSLKRQQFWDDSHHDHVSAQLKKGTQKQLPMLSKPQLSNVPFRCFHHYTWKGVTFGGWQHLFGVFPLSSMQENGNRSFHHPSVMKRVTGHTRLLLLQSLIPEPVNQLCEGFFFLLFVQSIGRASGVKSTHWLLWNIHGIPAGIPSASLYANKVQGRHECENPILDLYHLNHPRIAHSGC